MDYTKAMVKNKNQTNTMVDIILTVLEYKTDGLQALKRKGFCSNHLADLEVGDDVSLYLKESSFHLPPNLLNQTTRPILMIGAGSGIAPFRGFWQQVLIDSIDDHKKEDIIQRLEDLDLCNKPHEVTLDQLSGQPIKTSMTMFFGCRDKKCNLLEYETSIYLNMVKRFNAFSRETVCPKQYVSDIMKKEHQLIYEALVEQNGIIYVCGKIAMANTVFKTLVSIIAEQLLEQQVAQHSESANVTADDFINSLIDDGRYHQDIFGTDDV